MFTGIVVGVGTGIAVGIVVESKMGVAVAEVKEMAVCVGSVEPQPANTKINVARTTGHTQCTRFNRSSSILYFS